MPVTALNGRRTGKVLLLTFANDRCRKVRVGGAVDLLEIVPIDDDNEP